MLMVPRDDWPAPSEILGHYHRANEIYQAVDKAFLSLQGPKSLFYLKSVDEIAKILSGMSVEHEHQSVMMLTASIEATFQVDLQFRCVKKLTDHVSQALRQLAKKAQKMHRRIEIEDILDTWKEQIGHANAFGDLKQVIEYRHWLAHGRYWNQKSGLRNLNIYGTWNRWV